MATRAGGGAAFGLHDSGCARAFVSTSVLRPRLWCGRESARVDGCVQVCVGSSRCEAQYPCHAAPLPITRAIAKHIERSSNSLSPRHLRRRSSLGLVIRCIPAFLLPISLRAALIVHSAFTHRVFVPPRSCLGRCAAGVLMQPETNFSCATPEVAA